jgi:hypothetical protein
MMWAMGIATLCWLLAQGIALQLSPEDEFWRWCLGATVVYACAMAILGATFTLSLKSRR